MILLADDDPEILDLIGDLLTEMSWPHNKFSDGEFLLEFARDCAETVEVVLLDYQMPRRNGFDTLVELRRIPGLAHTPVVFFSADSTEERVIQGLDFGAEDYITKPFRIREFRSRLEKARKRYFADQNVRSEFGCLADEVLAGHWLGWPKVKIYALRCVEWNHFRNKIPKELSAGQWLAGVLRTKEIEFWLCWLGEGSYAVAIPQSSTSNNDSFIGEVQNKVRTATHKCFNRVEQKQGYTYAPRSSGQAEMISLDLWAWAGCTVNDPGAVSWPEMQQFLLRKLEGSTPGHEPSWASF